VSNVSIKRVPHHRNGLLSHECQPVCQPANIVSGGIRIERSVVWPGGNVIETEQTQAAGVVSQGANRLT